MDTLRTTHPAYFLWRFRYFIVGLSLLGAVIGAVVARVVPEKFDTSISFSINRIHQQNTAEYQYDGYYAIQASDLFSQTVLSWFLTPSVLLEIYGQAQIDPQISSIEELTSRFKAKKYSAQNIVVRFSERDHATAEKISSALTGVIETRAAEANTTEDQRSIFSVQGATPVIIAYRPVIWLTTVVGGIVALLIAVSISYAVSFLPVTRRTPAP